MNSSSALVAPKPRPARSQMSLSAYGSSAPFAAPSGSTTTAYSTLGQALTSTTSAASRAGQQASPEPTFNETQRTQPQMSSESRYNNYAAAQGPVQQQYPYSYSGQAPYEAAYQSTPSRPVRNDSTHSQSPQQPPPSQPPPPYNAPPAGYPTHAYGPQGWQWNGYHAQFVPPPAPPSESAQYQQPEGRPDHTQPPTSAPTEVRGPSSSPPKTEVRHDERSPRPLDAAPQPGKIRKAKEAEIASAPSSLPPAQPPPELDFVKVNISTACTPLMAQLNISTVIRIISNYNRILEFNFARPSPCPSQPQSGALRAYVGGCSVWCSSVGLCC